MILFLQSLHPKLHQDLRSEESLIGRFLGGSLSLGECPHWGRGLSRCCWGRQESGGFFWILIYSSWIVFCSGPYKCGHITGAETGLGIRCGQRMVDGGDGRTHCLPGGTDVQGAFLTGPSKIFLSVRLHSKSHQKSSEVSKFTYQLALRKNLLGPVKKCTL